MGSKFSDGETDLEVISLGTECPEQYYVRHNGQQVGYIRVRWGKLAAMCPDVGGEIVHWGHTDGYGTLVGKFDHGLLFDALKSIAKYVRENAMTAKIRTGSEARNGA